MIYFDYNASTPLCEAAQIAITQGLQAFGNPSSVHGTGQASRKIVEDARHKIARAIDLGTGDVIFTSGATEAINTIFYTPDFQTIITSEIEHDAAIKSLEAVKASTDKKCDFIKVHSSGEVDLEHLETLLKTAPAPTLVSVMYVNNETGVIQPVEKIVALCRQYGAFFHCDAVQAFGRFPLSFKDLDFDYMSISAHKCGGPKGCGALIKKRDIPYAPLLVGGGQEMNMRGGTQNLLCIAGFGAAAVDAIERLDAYAQLEKLRSKLEDTILEYCPQAVVHGKGAPRAANTISLTMPGIAAQTQLMRFDLEDIAVSAGSACSAGVQKISHVLQAMSVPVDIASCAIRISLGHGSTEQDVDQFIKIWKQIYTELSQKSVAS